MADKSFEEQVKKELSELRMKPADAVWPVVEAAIQKERKRRWLIWLFLLAGFTGASFWGYYFFNQDKKEVTGIPAQIQSLPKVDTKPTAKEKNRPTVITQSLQKTASGITTPANLPEGPSKNMKRNSVSTDGHISVKAQAKRVVSQDRETKDALVATTQKNVVVDKATKQEPALFNDKTVDINLTKEAKKDNTNPPVQTPAVTTVNNPATLVTAKDEKPIDTSSQVTPVNSGITAPPAPVPAMVNTKKNTWQWNIAVEAGRSGLRKGLDFGFAKDAAVFAAPPATNNGQSLGVGSEPAVKDAFSFGVQLQAKKQLGKKHALGLSAGYSLLQTSINVGRKVDSAAFWNNLTGSSFSGFYYTTTDSIQYYNKYHFLRLGVDAYTPFRLFKKINFQWQLGVGANILVATNGLHYDPVAKKLFNDNSLFAKTQIYMSTGIDLAIGKVPFLYIGPHWQYSFTNLTAKPGGDQHLFFSSVKISFVLPKKKK